MRTSKITINGEEYTTCFSTGVLIECEERSGSFEAQLEKVNSGSVKESFWLLHQLIKAGAAYDKEMGNEPKQISYEKLINVTSPAEYETMFAGIDKTISAGQERKVETESKNAETTQGN